MKPLAGIKVLVGPSSFGAADPAPIKRLLESGCDVVDNPFKRKLEKAELMDLLSQGVTGLIAGLEVLDREVLAGSRLKVISRCGAGVSNVDQDAARELGVQVRSTPDGPTNAVAELTLGAMIGLMRMIPQMDAALHRGEWSKHMGAQLQGKTVLIAGFGRIGRRVAELLAAFQVRILVADPWIEEVPDGISRVELEDGLHQADVIALHASGDHCLFGENEFSLIKKGVFLLNAARGQLIDEAALVRALDSGKIAGAWLDTFSQEPYTGPLRNYPQVVLTPHAGSYTVECRRRMETESAENLIAALLEHEGARQ